MTPKIIETAIQAAKKSKGTGRSRNYRVGACIFDGNTIISSKENTYKTHPFALKHSPYPYLHAETHCIVSAGIDNTPGCDILVVRLLQNDHLSMSRPCPSCLAAIHSAGLRHVYYSDWKGDIQKL